MEKKQHCPWISVLVLSIAISLVSAPLKASNSTKVRVLIASLALPLKIAGTKNLSVEGWSEGDFRKLPLENRDLLQLSFKRKTWVAEFKNPNRPLFELGFSTAAAAQPITFDQSLIRLVGEHGKVKLQGKTWPSPVYLLASPSAQQADAIVSVELEKYLEGVLAGEMPSDWPLEALKAQAIAARSYTLAQLKSHEKDSFQIRGDVNDQVYLPEFFSESPRISQAIEQTKSQILTLNHQPLKAFYHADCGGATESPDSVWKGSGSHRTIAKDNQCSLRAQNKWKYKIKKSTLSKILFKGDDEGENTKIQLQVAKKSDSGRALEIIVEGEKLNIKISGQDLRKAIGFDKIKSTLLEIRDLGDEVEFSGRGMGHGSGLCQWGARSLASEGKDAKSILKHYYPLAKIENIN